MSRPLASSHVDCARASSRVQNVAWTLALSAVLGCDAALATAQTAPPALVAELADYVEIPRTTSSDGRSSAARINVLLEEPGGARLFVAEHWGPLSIVDKTTRKAVSYINFNGSADAPGLFPKFAPAGGFVSGLMGFAFDPDYQRNGVFYTIHLENPALAGDFKPKPGVLPGLDASRFVPTKPIGMPANGQNLTREGVISECDRQQHQERDLRGHRAGDDAGAAAELHSPDERLDLQPDCGPGRRRLARALCVDGRRRHRRAKRRQSPQSAASRIISAVRSSGSSRTCASRCLRAR